MVSFINKFAGNRHITVFNIYCKVKNKVVVDNNNKKLKII